MIGVDYHCEIAINTADVEVHFTLKLMKKLLFKEKKDICMHALRITYTFIVQLF